MRMTEISLTGWLFDFYVDMFFFLLLTLILFNIWFICSGNVAPFFLGCGIFSSATVSVIYAVTVNRGAIPLKPRFVSILRLFAYCVWITKESMCSAARMIRNAWLLDVNPEVHFTTLYYYIADYNTGAVERDIYVAQRYVFSDFALAVSALSVTFTPGTVSVAFYRDSAKNNVIMINAYNYILSQGLRDIEKKVDGLEMKSSYL